MQRYFVAKEAITTKEVKITGDDVKHITRVMRMLPGDEIVCSDNDTRTVRCVIQSVSDAEVIAQIVESLEPNTELPIKVTVAQGLPKGDKLELVIQKGTELGAYAFLPFSAARSVVKWDQKKEKKKLERLEKIAKEAAEQSYRERIPIIHPSLSFSELQKRLPEYDRCVVAYEESAKEGEAKALYATLSRLAPGESLLVLIGPEGGFTKEEIAYLEGSGCELCGFGPRILRTETAPLYVLAAVSYHFELMR
ncbi:16S rRNA (uracil(1498)-N(3))-methyltransferase [Halalkalibacterium ligniniphilum]|uniref:16S rRNA (uracil(1498)-N(3))-methyltransferase n=1 Tax=Halalkalibacterium ligniniphilum TaxID=1134413 RepID=UPI000345DE92|nr:16S rRNA (uracil(1498)-N(3))-methyltransferase [Halalkalibacterium ligniniphilum]